MGPPWEPTEICAELATVGKSSMVKRFYFGDTLAKTTEEQTAANELNTKTVVKIRMVESLKANGGDMKMEDCLKGIVGGRQMKYDARDELVKDKVIKISGVPKSS